jgi:hypothetical protein
MNTIQFYQDYGIHYMTEGHKHCHPGWVHTECPLCEGNPGLHLGFNFDGNNFVCWRCGSHSKMEVIQALLSCSKQEAFEILRKYEKFYVPTQEKKININKKPFKLPSESEPLQSAHRKYLLNRGFNPHSIEDKWKVLGTGIYSRLGPLDFSRRIVIPIFWENKMVSFQARDITEKHPLRYIACPEERELINLKTIVYRHPETVSDTGICVEGVTDVWKVGKEAFAVFGIKYTQTQVKCIRKLYKKVVIFFDSDPQAQIQAKLLAAELSFFGVKTEIVIPPEGSDPGSMDEKSLLFLKNFL